MSLRVFATLCVAIGTAHVGRAQQFAPTTVQLPTFSTFTVGTVVAVPDSGLGFACGPRQVSNGYTAYGPAWGASTVSWHACEFTSVYFGAQTIDLAALDTQLLAGAPPAPVAPAHPFVQQLDAPRASSAAHVPGSVAAARRARAAAIAAETVELDGLIAKAEKLLADGKPNVARIYFQMAAEKTSGERRQALEARIALLKRVPAR